MGRIKFIFILLVQLSLYGNCSLLFSQQIIDTSRIYGVTVTSISGLSSTVNSLSSHSKKMTARIVFDEFMPATVYTNAVNSISNVSFIMGEILDSYYMNQYTHDAFRDRVTEYLNAFENKVDIWEIGNEVNGEWLGTIPSVIQKIRTAYDLVKVRNKKAAFTLYYNKECYMYPQNEMFRWVNQNLPNDIKNGIDYILVSYYEDDCKNYQPDWQQVFDSLRVIFPTAKLGIGECGTIYQNKKAEYMNRYYKMNITTPGYIGGYFWWYYKEDCVPKTKPLWSTLDNAILSSTTNVKQAGENLYYELYQNYPNPFNPVTKIKLGIPESGLVNLNVYDITGKLISKIVNKILFAGSYEFLFDASSHPGGIYFYSMQVNNNLITRKMLLIK